MQSVTLPSSAALYRKLIKAYVKKFDTQHDVIIRSWVATKEHFQRNAQLRDANEIKKAKEFAIEMHRYVTCGIIMAYEKHNEKGKKYFKVTREILQASNNHVNPASGQNFIEKFQEYMDPAEKNALIQKLKEAGMYTEKTSPGAVDDLAFKTRRKKPLVKDL